jgi:TolB protein
MGRRRSLLVADGTRIVYVSLVDGDNDIWVMNADGTGQEQLTFNSNNDFWPSWSPDGAFIVFESNMGGNFEIFVINADGTGTPRNLTNYSGASDECPSWSPF